MLAAALRLLARRDDLELVNLGQALDRVAPEWEAEIAEGSSWSCAHGILSDCGCSVGAQPGWTQAWRAPLLAALEALRTALADVFERESAGLLTDPWGARDRYVEVLLEPDRRDVEEILRGRRGGRSRRTRSKALRLLELQRQALLMFTSCGWFFAELSGIETVQVMKYAARAIQLARDAAGVDLEPAFVEALARAPSNVPSSATAAASTRRSSARAWRRSRASARTSRSPARCATCRRRGDCSAPLPPRGEAPCAVRSRDARHRADAPRASSRRRRSTRCSAWSTSAPQTSRCGLVPYPGAAAHEDRAGAPREAGPDLFARLLREVDRAFPRARLRATCSSTSAAASRACCSRGPCAATRTTTSRVFEDNRRLMEFLREIDSPVPTPLRVAADVTLTRRILDVTGRALSGEVRLADAEVELLAVVGARPSARGALRRRGGAP